MICTNIHKRLSISLNFIWRICLINFDFGKMNGEKKQRRTIVTLIWLWLRFVPVNGNLLWKMLSTQPNCCNSQWLLSQLTSEHKEKTKKFITFHLFPFVLYFLHNIYFFFFYFSLCIFLIKSVLSLFFSTWSLIDNICWFFSKVFWGIFSNVFCKKHSRCLTSKLDKYGTWLPAKPTGVGLSAFYLSNPSSMMMNEWMNRGLDWTGLDWTAWILAVSNPNCEGNKSRAEKNHPKLDDFLRKTKKC